MFDTINLPVISPIAGPSQDGLLLGRINSSDITVAHMLSRLVTIQKVLREDMIAGGSTLTDVTTAATDATVDDFQPFGTDLSMSDGDAFYFYVTDGQECNRLHVQIATPGVGTWTIEMQEWNATTESWVAMTLADQSNGFKAAVGVYQLNFTHVYKGSLKLHSTDTAKHVWHRVVLKNPSGVTTEPSLSRIWAETDVDVYIDTTAAINNGTWSVLPAEIIPAVGNVLDMLVHPGVPTGLDVNVNAAESGNFTTVREYWATDGAWKTIPDLADPSNGYRNTGNHRIRWSRPSDWASKSNTVNSVTHTGWFERRRISAVVTQGPIAPCRVTADSRALGSANAKGLVLGSVSYSYATFTAGANNATGNTVLAFINADTGETATVTIPQNVDDASDTSDGKLPLSATLTLTTGQSILVMCISGGTMIDVGMRLH